MRIVRRSVFAFALILSACGDDGGGGDDGSSGAPGTTGMGPTSAPGDDDGGTTSTTAPADGTTTGNGTTTAADTGPSTTGGSEDTGPMPTTGGGATQVVFETTMGQIVIELDEVAAPVTAANFLAYVEAGFYDGADGLGSTIFHRVIPGFVIQGGGLTESLQTKSTMPPIVNEFGNGLTNLRGTISMARTSDPDSATSQFFINLVDNDGLDAPPGYAVFGEVVVGLDVVDAIAGVATTTMGPYDDVPVEPIIVTSATVQ